MTNLTHSSHWVWGSWWRKVLRKRIYYYKFKPEAGTFFMKFDELSKKWTAIEVEEFEDSK